MIAEDDATNMFCLIAQINKITNFDMKVTKCWNGQ